MCSSQIPTTVVIDKDIKGVWAGQLKVNDVFRLIDSARGSRQLVCKLPQEPRGRSLSWFPTAQVWLWLFLVWGQRNWK